MMTRKDFQKFKPGTPEYILLHGKWQASRGRNPSAVFSWLRNPRKALKMAQYLAYFPESGTYLGGVIPGSYRCAECGAFGCKLWREYQQTVSPSILCASCAAKEQNKDIRDIDADGWHTCKDRGSRSDQIGWYVPAVPTEDNTVYWGYTSVPRPGMDWWRKLPTLPSEVGV